MNLNKDEFIQNLKETLTSKLFYKIYLILFILLNIADFYGISGDLDFFKKILSWILIGYLFYKVSITQIFIGIKDKYYDLILILIFSLMIIPRMIKSYTITNNISNYNIFSPIFTLFNNMNELFLEYILFISILLIILVSIQILNKYEYKENSFLGSFNLSEYLLFIKFDYIILILSLIFFSLTIFNLFMEWFALAIDALILVIGLIYYLSKYLIHHTNLNTQYLSNVSNTGNQFFTNIIETFNNKNTILIGICFILTLHLAVDAGAYLVPDTLGTGSSLYIENLNFAQTDHTPIFNIKNISNSQIHYDNQNLKLIDSKISYLILLISIIIININTLFLFFNLLLLPLYILYKNILKKQINFSKLFTILFISSLFLFLSLNLLTSMPNNQNDENRNNNKILSLNTIPIGLENLNSNTHLSGIDIHTNTIIHPNNNPYSILIPIIIYIITTIIIFFIFEKFNTIFQKIILIIALIFFIIYITVFSISTIQLELTKLNLQDSNKQIEQTQQIQNNSILKYNQVKTLIDNKSNFNIEIRKEIDLKYNLKLKLTLFSNKNKNTNLTHKDYIKYEIINNQKNIDSSVLQINKNTKLYLNSNQKNPTTKQIYYLKNIDFNSGIIQLKNNTFNFSETNTQILSKLKIKNNNKIKSQELIFNKNYILIIYSNPDYINNQILNHKINIDSSSIIKNSSEYIRIIFFSIFYIFGIIFFIFYYITNIIFKNNEIEDNYY